MDPNLLASHTVPGTELICVAFSPNSPNFLTSGTDKMFHLHQVLSQYRRVDFKVTNPINTMHPLADGTLIVCGDSRGKIVIATPSIRIPMKIFTAHATAVNSIDFNSDESKFVTSSNDGSAKIWDFPSKKWVSTLKGHKGWVNSAEYSNDQNIICTGSNDRTVRLWDSRTSKSTHVFGSFKSYVTDTSFHPSGTILGISFESGDFCIFDARSQRALQNYKKAHEASITSLDIHPTGNFALTVGLDSNICIWDLSEGQAFYTITAHNAPIFDGKWNDDGSQFLTCDKSGVVNLWQTNFDKLIKTIADRSGGADTVDQRISQAMDIAPPQKKSPPEPIQLQGPFQDEEEFIAPSKDAIESGLNRMVNQLDMLTNTFNMMDRRMEMNETIVEKLQNRKNHL